MYIWKKGEMKKKVFIWIYSKWLNILHHDIRQYMTQLILKPCNKDILYSIAKFQAGISIITLFIYNVLNTFIQYINSSLYNHPVYVIYWLHHWIIKGIWRILTMYTGLTLNIGKPKAEIIDSQMQRTDSPFGIE